MKRALQVAGFVALLCACGFFVAASSLLIRANDVLQQWQAANVAAHVNATLDAVNRPCGGKQACGTLADVAKTLGTFRGAAGQIEVAANHEDKRIGVVDAQEAQIYLDTHRSLTQLHADLATANTSIAAVQPVLDGLTKETQALQVATASVDALVSNPQIPVILKNTADATGSVQQASAHLEATTADVQQAVHSALHPTVVHKVLSVVTNAAHIVFAIVF